MKKLNVMLDFDDQKYDLKLEVHQQVTVEGHESEAEIVRLAKLEFCRWARGRSAEWQLLALKVPTAPVNGLEISSAA